MSLSDGIKRLMSRLAEIESRLFDLEQALDEVLNGGAEFDYGPDQIGFDVEAPDEFDEDASEYRKGK